MRERGQTGEEDRGQSEVIGFVIVFSAILAATVVVSVFGLSALNDVRESTVANNGETAMQALGSDVEAIYYGSAESRTTELTLDSASLAVGDPTRVKVRVPSAGIDREWKLYPLVYRSDAASIYYEDSLVVRQQPTGAVAVTDSLFRMSDERAIVPIVRTNAAANVSVRGGTHRVEFVGNGTESVVHSEPSPFSITITIEDVPGRERVWADTLNEAYTGSASTPCTPDLADDKVVCDGPSFETERLLVTNATVSYTVD
ncbi:MAG: hypothetical protein ABEJ26_01240 [Halosimplex sp.]